MDKNTSQQIFQETYSALGIYIGPTATDGIALHGLVPNLVTDQVQPYAISGGQMSSEIQLVSGFIQSSNFVSGSAGWSIDSSGNVEFNNGTFRGIITGSSLNIPDSTTASSFHVDSSGNTWWGTNVATGYATAPARILSSGQLHIGNTTNYLDYNGTNLSLYSNLANAITLDRGSNMILKEGGNLNFTSVTVAGACTAALIATGTGNVDNGTHTYKVEFVTTIGGTGIATAVASNTVTVDGTHKQVSLTGIPVSSSGAVTSRKIYRTTVAGTYLLLTTIGDNVTTTYTDNTADASLTGTDAGSKQNSTFGKINIDSISSLNLGISNTSAGQSAGTSTTTGYGDTAFGWSSLTNNTGGYNNTAIGASALPANTTGYENTSLGSSSMHGNLTGDANTALGYFTLYNGTASRGCTTVGYSSSFNTTGNFNTALGWEALYQNTGGTNNVALGVLSLYTTTGNSNIGIGYAAGYQASTSNELYIDNQTRASNAVEKTNSIIYGVMDSVATNQILTVNAIIKPIQAVTASAPAYVKGAIYFDTTLNKLRVGGATAWETITSV